MLADVSQRVARNRPDRPSLRLTGHASFRGLISKGGKARFEKPVTHFTRASSKPVRTTSARFRRRRRRQRQHLLAA